MGSLTDLYSNALIHNQAIHISTGALKGVYRVVLDLQRIDTTVLVAIPVPGLSRAAPAKLKQKESAAPKKPKLPLVGELIWQNRNELMELINAGHLKIAEIQRENISMSDAAKRLHERRITVMAPFLNYSLLSRLILEDEGLGGLVKLCMAAGGSRSMVYQCWSRLCRYGFIATSLRPRSDLCGAPNVPRFCEFGRRKKAGRKTYKQRIAKSYGMVLEPDQPGMSEAWTRVVCMADRKIETPKPKMRARYNEIIRLITPHLLKEVAGEFVQREPEIGEVPNFGQVKRALERVPRLQRLLESTTAGHFARSLRGMNGRNWKGVAGPGHTWAIDSTVGDMYLRSSVNRAWILGRPIVYIMVDVWSTAVVGFYVCLRGPSWEMAKIALFSAAAPPGLIADLWQYDAITSLVPAPTLPASLMCDRGEYLSKAASQTALQLIPCMSYAPPYRPDMKGLVEVLHRISKDTQYYFIPGAIDARRKEYDLRKFDPNTAVFTVREYTEYLHYIFSEYNLTADRTHRIDSHMAAAGVTPTPAGLWRWGHAAGVGLSRAFSTTDLITTLLPEETAKITKLGVRFGGSHYESPESKALQWTAHARNFGAEDIPAYHFPGSVSRIWTPKSLKAGLFDLRLSQQSTASPEQTFDERMDAHMFAKANAPVVQHANLLTQLATRDRVLDLVAAAEARTAEALAGQKDAPPSMKDARKLEGTAAMSAAEPLAHTGVANQHDEANAAYAEFMKSTFALMNSDKKD